MFAANAFIIVQRLLPQHALSRFAGIIARARLLRKPLIRLFCRIYAVDLTEADRESVSDYLHFNDFFTRALKPDARPLAGGATAVCPADGAISQAGTISCGRLLQAKGHGYSLAALFGEATPAVLERFDGGSFATIYLAPRDYHRVHMPSAGRLLSTRAIPGALYSVNAVTEAHIEGLFARNERLVCHFETDHGAMAVILVGAMIVAGIDTVWPGPASPYREVTETSHPELTLPRGAELGRFFLGSTVIVCMERHRARLRDSYQPGTPVRMGQALFDLLPE